MSKRVDLSEPGARTGTLGDMRGQKHPYCRECRHFYITWEPDFPYGCRGFGMKSRYMPYLEVFRSSGKSCQLFIRSENKQR